MKILMGENLVYDAPVQVGSHHYARLFAKENDVFWLSIPWNAFLFLRYGAKGDRFTQWNKGLPYIEDGIKLWCPFTFVPYRDNLPFRSMKNIERTLKYTVPGLDRTLSRNGFGKCDVLWITDPRMMGLCDVVEYDLLVYRCVDDLSHFSTIPKNIRVAEENLAKKADLVFATANTLKTRLESYGVDVYSLPNAVDYDYFAQYSTVGLKTKIDELNNVIVYVGTIGEWFDSEFIRYCAMKRPSYSFVVIGPIRTDTSRMQQLSNVHLLGSIDYTQVPLYMKRSSIGIIPFKLNALVDAVNPLKLYEYFACGIPVVATAAHELKALKSPALLYESYDEALEYFDMLMDSGGNEDLYTKYARDNSWKARYDFIMDRIDASLENKDRGDWNS